MISHTLSGVKVEKTNTLPSFGVISTALANEVVYAIEPSSPTLTPTPKYLPNTLVFLQEEISLSKKDFLSNRP